MFTAAAVLAAAAVAEALTERSLAIPALVWFGRLLARPVRVPLGVLIALPLIGAAVYGLRRWRKGLPRLEHYTRDRIGGVLWEWDWRSGEPTPSSQPICPRCLRPMLVAVDPAPPEGEPPADRASCACGYEQMIGRGGTYLSDLFMVEVERRIRIGYWREALERWGRRGQPIPEPDATA